MLEIASQMTFTTRNLPYPYPNICDAFKQKDV